MNYHVRIVYTNHEGRTKIRNISPQAIRFGYSKWHPKQQWLLDAFDLDKNADRTFAMNGIVAWGVEA